MANNPFLTGSRGSRIANNPMTGKPAPGFDKNANPFLQGSRGSKIASNPFHQGSRGSRIAENPMSNPQLGRAPAQPADSGPLASLNNPSRFRTVTYPRNIDAVDHYMTISAYETQHFAAFGGQRENKSIIQKIVLPMPSQLITGYSQEYKNEQIGIAGRVVGGALAENVDKLVETESAVRNAFADPSKEAGVNALDKASSFIAGTIRTLSKDINAGVVKSVALAAAKDGAAALAGAATLGLGGAALAAGAAKGVEAFTASLGLARNPHAAVMYDSPNFRAFNFSWELRPKNYYESINIARIIGFLKYYSAPSFAKGFSNHFFKYPNQFRLKIKHDEFLFAFGDCILKNFEVDYHGEGTPIYYDAAGSIRAGNRRLKAPAVVKINTEWQETSIVTKETIENEGR